MKKALVVIGVGALVAAAPAASVANKSDANRAKVMKAKIAATGVAGYENVKGKAHLVDGKKNNVVSLHARGLVAGGSYHWHVHEIPATATGDPCMPGGPAGPPVSGFTFGNPVTANEDGNLNVKARAKGAASFNLDSDSRYYVNVHLDDATLTVVGCGELALTKKSHPAHAKGPKAS